MLVRALGYVKRTQGWKLRLQAKTPATDLQEPITLEAWTDSNFADKSDERVRSHMGWNITLNGVLVASRSNRQTFTANSTHEAECVAAHNAMEEMMMTTALLEEMGFKVLRPQTLNCDNNSSVMTYGSELPEWRTPTLGTKYWHSRDYVDNGDIAIKHVPGTENPADLHTKWLPNCDHLKHTRWLGLYDPANPDVD